MANKRFGCLGAVLIGLLCLSLLANLIFVLTRGASAAAASLSGAAEQAPKFDEEVVVAARNNSPQKIAMIYLRGIITGMEPGSVGVTMVDDLRIQLKQASDDPKVKAVLLYVDSPGGEVTASDMIYNAVRRVRDDAKKPVVVYMGSVAASGGYYVACGGSWLMANETTFTGSIGVIMQTLNYQQLFGKVGLQTFTFKSGEFKDMLSGSREPTDAEKAYIQGLVMQTYGKFVGIVAKERGLPEDQLRSGIADGRVVSGKDALEAKLINQLGEVEDAYAKAMELGGAADAAIIRYESGFKLGKLFNLFGQSEKAKIEVNLTQSLMPKLEAGRFYYLPSIYAQ
ncbi:MAG: Signal peptide peptidase SppA, type [Chthoniobacteraceae bacterium]|nr:Signal peptide peptidase SppA, type [Chthoniobacteraceae bacterium]